MRRAVGIDFGTTNSALALVGSNGPELAQFSHEGGLTKTFRSILYFEAPTPESRGNVISHAGPQAIERYLASDGAGRLVQSIKSHLASDLRSTVIFGRTFSLEDMAAVIVRSLCSGAEAQFGPLGERVVVGRPVRFAGADTPQQEEAALKRLKTVFQTCGFSDVVFEYEPVGAAYFYESTLDHDELVLIADFGGGTSDFCLVEVGPRARRRRPEQSGILGTEGVALAGDAFDSEIVGNVVAPKLGKGSVYKSYLDGKEIAVPPWIYLKLNKWHQLSFLRSKDTMHLLDEIKAQSVEREKIEALIHLIEYDLGYHLYRSVEQTKIELSSARSSELNFSELPVSVTENITRHDFDAWTSRLVSQFSSAVDRLLANACAEYADVDKVFLTGGSSLIPAVRHIFRDRFGDQRLQSGGELTSVALGLALRAQDL